MATVLFTAPDLTDYLQRPVDDASARIAARVVRGWLLAAGYPDWNDGPISEGLFSAALELGAIAIDNPNGDVSSSTTGSETDVYRGRRRAEIIAEALAGGGGGGRGAPQGCFPEPSCWPDPADRRRTYHDQWHW